MSETEPSPGGNRWDDTAAVLAALQGDKTYVKGPGDTPEPEPKAEPEAKEDEPGDDAPAAAAEGEAEKPKPKKTAQERIDEITAQKHEAAREAEFWKAKALGTRRLNPPQRRKTHRKVTEGPTGPTTRPTTTTSRP
jgi:hypothetical protein